MTANPKRHVAKRLTMNKRLSTQRIKSPKQPPKTTTINDWLSYQMAQDDPACLVTICHTDYCHTDYQLNRKKLKKRNPSTRHLCQM